MKKFLATFALLLAFTLPGFAQGQVRLSAEDQKKFDKHYAKWVNDTRKNDRDDIAKDVHEMQEIMAKYNIPANVPYDQIASTGSGVRVYQSRLSADDQRARELARRIEAGRVLVNTLAHEPAAPFENQRPKRCSPSPANRSGTAGSSA